MENWPSDLSALDDADKLILASPTTLRQTIRAHRELRKTENITEEEVINFYSNLIGSISNLIEDNTFKAKRFDGWSEFLGVFYSFQTVCFTSLTKKNDFFIAFVLPIVQKS